MTRKLFYEVTLTLIVALLAVIISIRTTSAKDSDLFRCGTKAYTCKKEPCVSYISKSIGSVASVSCMKVYIKDQRSFTGEWDFLYYELELISSQGKSTFAHRIEVRDLN